ncbi:CHAP domain-containing protein [Luteibacter sp. 22Crub2.1]|uniref:CHAP domain-containing protein n=1 Tax=Luteibacter sp. 22Crub2.1 TaxID=1283288 RepID=UPI0011178283|nr:CHAP domain-containing protein [Luteibacter sp. 22Crub2.1]
MRQGLEADTNGHPVDAKDFGPTLVNSGFTPVADDGYTPQVGDTAVFQPPGGGSAAGHIETWDRGDWVSDFNQHSFYANHGYKTESHQVYRPPAERQHREKVRMTKPTRFWMLMLLFGAGSMSSDDVFAVERKSGPGAVQAVAHLYRDHAWEAMASSSGPTDTSFGPPIAQAPRRVLEQYFEKHLVDLLELDSRCVDKHKGDVCNLDFNILFSSQDPAATDLTVEATGTNHVMVSFTYPSNSEKIRIEYLTVETPYGWRIKDIIFHNRNDSSLATILARPTAL